jgi:hypothetical protein
MIKFYLTAIFLTLVTSCTHVFSQTPGYIRGKIISSENFEPVGFATVSLKQNRLGIFTNAEGDFKIPKESNFESDSLIVSSIGFKRKAIAFSSLDKARVNRIVLETATYSLKEIKVIASKDQITSETLIRRAIRRIVKNYPVNPFSYVSYYRDYQKKDSLYINLNEAIVRTWDNGFDKKSALNDYSLLDFRKNLDFLRSNITPYYDNNTKFIPSATLPDQGGNELLILMVHDALRNFRIPSFSFIYRFSVNFINNHIFSQAIPVYDNNLLLYKINFKANHYLTGDSLEVSGDIYIQPKNYAIYKLDYSAHYLTEADNGKEMFSIKTEYGNEENRDPLLRLKYISFSNLFRAADTSDLYFLRITESYTDDPFTFGNLFIGFNNALNRESASDTSNYAIMFGSHKAVINRISVGDRRVILTLKYDSTMKSPPKVLISNIRDIYGNVLNERKYSEYYQYRELFVENYNSSVVPKDTCYVKTKPLDSNCKTGLGSREKYWMNTPASVKSLKEQK